MLGIMASPTILEQVYCERAPLTKVPFGHRHLYYKILISSRAATISWWDRRFACHRPRSPRFVPALLLRAADYLAARRSHRRFFSCRRCWISGMGLLGIGGVCGCGELGRS